MPGALLGARDRGWGKARHASLMQLIVQRSRMPWGWCSDSHSVGVVPVITWYTRESLVRVTAFPRAPARVGLTMCSYSVQFWQWAVVSNPKDDLAAVRVWDARQKGMGCCLVPRGYNGKSIDRRGT